MRIRLLDDNLPARLNELARVHGAGTLRRMPTGAAHGPQGLHGLHLCGSILTDTILYIHTVFHDDPGGVMGRRLARGRDASRKEWRGADRNGMARCGHHEITDRPDSAIGRRRPVRCRPAPSRANSTGAYRPLRCRRRRSFSLTSADRSGLDRHKNQRHRPRYAAPSPNMPGAPPTNAGQPTGSRVSFASRRARSFTIW